MPMYEYMCTDCGNRFDKFLPLARYDEDVICCDCLVTAKKVMTANFHCDEEAWIHTTSEALTGENDAPITNRTEYNKRIKDNGLVAVG
jgi:putative FmdB family regulatory protein